MMQFSIPSSLPRHNVKGAKTFSSEMRYAIDTIKPRQEDGSGYDIVELDTGKTVQRCKTEAELQIWLDMLGLELLGPTLFTTAGDEYTTRSIKGPAVVSLS